MNNIVCYKLLINKKLWISPLQDNRNCVKGMAKRNSLQRPPLFINKQAGNELPCNYHELTIIYFMHFPNSITQFEACHLALIIDATCFAVYKHSWRKRLMPIHTCIDIAALSLQEVLFGGIVNKAVFVWL